MNKLYGKKNTEFFNDKTRGKYSNHSALKCQGLAVISVVMSVTVNVFFVGYNVYLYLLIQLIERKELSSPRPHSPYKYHSLISAAPVQISPVVLARYTKPPKEASIFLTL
jgi:hypothetical protein